MTHLITFMLFIVPIVITFGWVFADERRKERIEKRINRIFE